MNKCFSVGCDKQATTEFCPECLANGGFKPFAKDKLLVIELENETAVPKVFYQGEEITNKVRISFDWETDTDEFCGTRYNVEYIELVNHEPIRKGVGLACGKYGYDEQ